MTFTAQPKPIQQCRISSQNSKIRGDGVLFIDFGKAAYASVEVAIPSSYAQKQITVILGEKLNQQGVIDRDPPGCIRAITITQNVQAGEKCHIRIPADERNTGVMAIAMPEHIGEVYPFRYMEIENAGEIGAQDVRQLAAFYPFNDDVAQFKCSDPILNEVWELCKYSIKATTFCGVYVDGDRERIPYEGDAYINQLGHYCTDQEYALARYSHEYLLRYPTWPTEWQQHSILMAYADYLYSGEISSLIENYELLQAKLMLPLAREDGLISTENEARTEEFEKTLNLYHDKYIYEHGLRDLVDWPPGSFTDGGTGERDNHEMLAYNSVVNAFHYETLRCMQEIAVALEKFEDARLYAERGEVVYKSFQNVFYNTEKGYYMDGEGSEHGSLHSQMFALAFDLVPQEHKKTVVEHAVSRGMACSVYGAQYLLEALYKHGVADDALALMRAQDDRSWYHMIQSGSTMTWEAWDYRYKNNLDWNHAWGAAPANIIPRYLMGVRPEKAGFREVCIQPQCSKLIEARITVPSPLGIIRLAAELDEDEQRFYELVIPQGMRANFYLPPGQQRADYEVQYNGSLVEAETAEQLSTELIFSGLESGTHLIQISPV